MKKIMLIACTLFTLNSYAVEMCVNIPDAISAESIELNFDGSTTYFKPNVYVDGAYLPMHTDNNTVDGFCAISNMEYVSVSFMPVKIGLKAVKLKAEGLYFSTIANPRYIIEKIVCK